jgi:hypothetical protein
MTTGAYEGSLFAEGVSVRFKASPFHEAASAAGSVFFLGFELHSLHRMERGAAWVRRRPHPLGPQEVDDRDIRGSIELSPWEENAHASRVSGSPVPRGSTLQPDPPKRSSWRETTVYLGSSQEAARRAPEPGARNPENTRDAGFRLDSLDGRSRSVTSWQETPSAKAAGNEPV